MKQEDAFTRPFTRPFPRHARPANALACCLMAAAAAALPPPRAAAAGLDDPFGTGALHAASAGESLGRPLRAGPCREAQKGQPLTLANVVDLALCNNPQTGLAWANARSQAAQVGVAESAYLPSLTATGSRSRNAASGSASVTRSGGDATSYQTAAGLSLSYLLYDFGGREAALENARQLLAALNATQDATLQSVFLAAVQAFYQWHAAEAAVQSARESERSSLESLKAADARYRVGTGTPADRLQAQTAASQATLTRIQAEGNAKTARGVLANAMGLDAQDAPPVAPPAEAAPDARFERNVGDLIGEAKRFRPDLAAAEAQVKAAQAGIDSARATGLPSLSLFANRNYSDTGLSDASRSSAVGVSISIPLFTGFNTAYRVKSAEAQLDARAAQRDQLSKQVSLDVWRAYHALMTATEAVRASADLVASAEQSDKVAAGRYKAGVGGILDLLNAQSALAGARQQDIQALFNWRVAKVALGQAMGQLDFSLIESAGK